MAKRNGKIGLQTIRGVAATLLLSQTAVSAPALGMDLDAQSYRPAPALKIQNPYKAKLVPFVSQDGSPSGFGLFASSGHRTVNLSQPTSWSVNPDASTSGTAVGLGWRARNISTTMGYVRPASGASTEAFSSADGVQRFRPRSMVGIGFALHY